MLGLAIMLHTIICEAYFNVLLIKSEIWINRKKNYY